MKKIFLFTFLLIGGIVFYHSVFALTVSPPVVELGGNPGQEVKSVIRLFNETDQTVNIWTSTADFGAKKGEEGEPVFYEPTEKENDLSKWIKIIPGPINIPSLSWQSIPFSVKIPENADPGGHYAAIFFGNQPSEKSKAVGIVSKVGSLVLLRVTGDVYEEGKLLNFSLKDKKKFFEFLPVTFEIRFQNSGNVHLKPQGEIVITDMVGRVEGKVPVNKVRSGGNVLPNSIRKYESAWVKKEYKEPPSTFWGKVLAEKNNFALGKYRASLTLEYGLNPKKAYGVLYFWVFPWHLILVSVVGFIILILLLYFGIKKYNKWIVEKVLREREIQKR